MTDSSRPDGTNGTKSAESSLFRSKKSLFNITAIMLTFILGFFGRSAALKPQRGGSAAVQQTCSQTVFGTFRRRSGCSSSLGALSLADLTHPNPRFFAALALEAFKRITAQPPAAQDAQRFQRLTVHRCRQACRRICFRRRISGSHHGRRVDRTPALRS